MRKFKVKSVTGPSNIFFDGVPLSEHYVLNTSNGDTWLNYSNASDFNSYNISLYIMSLENK